MRHAPRNEIKKIRNYLYMIAAVLSIAGIVGMIIKPAAVFGALILFAGVAAVIGEELYNVEEKCSKSAGNRAPSVSSDNKSAQSAGKAEPWTGVADRLNKRNRTVPTPELEDYELFMGSTVKHYRGQKTSVRVPDRIMEIGTGAFRNSSVTSVILPMNVEKIGYHAFEGCSKLKHIVIMSPNCEIQGGAFDGCDSISTAGPLGSGCDYEFAYQDRLADYMFASLKGLTSVMIPEGVTQIGEGCFRNCSSLRTIRLPNSVRSILPEAFVGCASLSRLDLPDGRIDLDQIMIDASVALADNDGFIVIRKNLVGYVGAEEEIVIPKEVTRISRNVFSARTCPKNLKIRSVLIPEGVTYIGEGAFADCENLEDVELPENLAVIESEAFYRCRHLSHVKLPKELRLLGKRAFQGCSYLKTCEIPKSLTTIQEGVFQDCPSLALFLPETVADVEKNAFLQCFEVSTVRKPTDGVEKALNAYKKRQALIKKELNAWLPAEYDYVPEGRLNKFYSFHASELSREAYYSLLNEMDSAICSSGEDDGFRLWLESENKLEFRARDEHFVWHDETVIESCAIQLSLEQEAPSGIIWEAASTGKRTSCRIPCKGSVLLCDRSSKSGDNWSYCNVTDCQYLLLEPYGMQGIWKLSIYIKNVR